MLETIRNSFPQEQLQFAFLSWDCYHKEPKRPLKRMLSLGKEKKVMWVRWLFSSHRKIVKKTADKADTAVIKETATAETNCADIK